MNSNEKWFDSMIFIDAITQIDVVMKICVEIYHFSDFSKGKKPVTFNIRLTFDVKILIV